MKVNRFSYDMCVIEHHYLFLSYFINFIVKLAYIYSLNILFVNTRNTNRNLLPPNRALITMATPMISFDVYL